MPISFNFFSDREEGGRLKRSASFFCTPGSAAAATCLCVSGIRYRRGPATVRNMRAVLKKASWGTRRIFRSIRCKKQASTVRKRYSVPETAFWRTERIFKGALNSLLLHRMHFRKRKNGILSHRTHLQRPAEQPTPQTVDSLLPTGRIFSARNGPRSEVSRHKKRVYSLEMS